MRDWLQEERSHLTDDHVLYRLLGVLEAFEQKVDTALAKCKRAGTGQEYLSIKQSASMTGLSSTHLRRTIKRGELLASNIGTLAHPIWRISRKDLIAWLDTKKGEITVIPPKAELRGLVNRYFG